MVEIERHRTAIGRGGELSRPMRLAVEAGFVGEGRPVFDFGCGRGEDIALLHEMGVPADGWDPAHRPDAGKSCADVVNIGYVINVIEDVNERRATLREAWSLAKSVLVVAARLTFDSRLVHQERFSDGCLTGAHTFQKFFSQSELRNWIEETLEAPPVAAAPGIFFVFRHAEQMHDYLSRRYRRRRSAPRITKSEKRFQEHQAVLEPLMQFVTDRGRLPQDGECAGLETIAETFGSVRRAFAVIKRVTGTEQWDEIRRERTEELLLQLALDRFGGRPRFSELPVDLQRDVREFCSSYKAGCESADELLFSVGDVDLIDQSIARSAIGKRTGNGLYVHVDWIHALSLPLRVYEGCARAYLGSTEEANVVKLHRGTPRVSYLTYPGFDSEVHPELQESFLVKLGALDVSYRSYVDSDNPPILHRLEELVAPMDDRYARFARVTKQEERWGLYDRPQTIGSRRGWESVLKENGAEYRGRRLVRRQERS